MKFTIENTAGKKVKVIDAMGRTIPAVFSYDSKTRRAEVYLVSDFGKTTRSSLSLVTYRLKNGSGGAVKMKAHLPGSHIIVDGKKY